MKQSIIVVAGIALSLALGSAIADDAQPLLPIGDQLAPLSDSELGNVTGGFFDTCFLCALTNNASVNQLNLSAVSALVAQSNASAVIQGNN